MAQTPKESKPVDQLLREKKIYQVVNPKLVQAPSDIALQEAIQLMQREKSSYIVVAEHRRAVGIFTEVDVVRKELGQDVNWNRQLRDFMAPGPKILNIKDSVGAAIDLMGAERFYHIPLVDDRGELVNVISVRTLIRFLAEFYPTEVYNLPPKADQIMWTPEGG
ncbi:MAG: CBS domain-containing protein, partial [Candidatus Omnitrophica bacterium]|nr:CBS domain-containing protein [Candidatus Omnitrophota bacterium]